MLLSIHSIQGISQVDEGMIISEFLILAGFVLMIFSGIGEFKWYQMVISMWIFAGGIYLEHLSERKEEE